MDTGRLSCDEQSVSLRPAMPQPTFHPRDPLHGITLATIVQHLVDRHGWNEMARRIPIRCFMFDPSLTSSLKFLRKTPWARQKVEGWFISELPARPPAPRPAAPPSVQSDKPADA